MCVLLFFPTKKGRQSFLRTFTFKVLNKQSDNQTNAFFLRVFFFPAPLEQAFFARAGGNQQKNEYEVGFDDNNDV